jgi:hypothetical protein
MSGADDRRPARPLAGELLTKAQVGAIFQRVPRSIANWERRGLLRRVPGLGRSVYFRRADVERLIGIEAGIVHDINNIERP